MKSFGLRTYFAQRFPIIGVLFLSLVVGYSAAPLYSVMLTEPMTNTVALITLTFVAFLLRQRVTDEFKDKSHDARFYPERPFQTGVVSAKTLIALGCAAFIVELTAAYFVNPSSFFLYIFVVLSSGLLAKEYFIGEWLARHFTVYFVLHEIIFIPLAVWILHVYSVPSSPATMAWVVFFVTIMMAIEVGRKFSLRRGTDGRIVKDTYTAVWGRNLTISLLGLLLVAASIAVASISNQLAVVLIPTAAVPLLFTFQNKDNLVKSVIIIAILSLIIAGALL